MTAIDVINKLLGGMFRGGKTTRNEEFNKLLATIGEFAGASGDFARFTPSGFETRFAEFGFSDPEEGLDAFTKLLEGLEHETNLHLDPKGLGLALNTAKSLKGRYDQAARCVKQLATRATNFFGAGHEDPDFVKVLNSLGQVLAQCPLLLEIANPDQRSKAFQELDLLKGEDPVNCALAIAAASSGISADKLASAKQLTADHCPITDALLKRVTAGH
jgi:hypothetical protein